MTVNGAGVVTVAGPLSWGKLVLSIGICEGTEGQAQYTPVRVCVLPPSAECRILFYSLLLP